MKVEEESIRSLCERTGCKEEEARVVLEVTTSLDDAERIICAFKEKNICILKGRIKAENAKLYGLFFVAFNIFEKKLSECICVLSQNIWMAHYDTDASWEEFLKNVKALGERKKEISKHATSKLKNYFKEHIHEFIQLLLKGEELLSKVTQDLRFLFDDPSVEVTLSEDRISSLPKEKEEVAEELQIKLKILLVLSPATGKPVWELQKGDKVLVKIVDESPLAQYLAELMGAKKGGKLIPIPAEVEDVSAEGDERLRIITRFGPGVVGESIVVKNLRVFEALEKPTKTSPVPLIKDSFSSLQTRSIDYIIILLIGLILLVLLFK